MTVQSTSQTTAATATTTAYPAGMAYLAGQRSPTSRMPTVRTGARAKRLSRARSSVQATPEGGGVHRIHELEGC